MPTLTGTVADVTGVAVPNNLIREVFVKAPASRPAGGNPAQLVTTRIVPVTVGSGGTLSVALDPGPAVLVIHTVGAAPDTFNLVVLGNMTTLREAIIEDIGELPELEQSQLVALAAQVRADAAQVSADKGVTMAARDGASAARDEAVASAAAALVSEGNAKTSETNAAGSASTATSQAGVAATRANEAKGYRDSAATHAGTATTQAGVAKDEADRSRDEANRSKSHADNFNPTVTVKPLPAGSTPTVVKTGTAPNFNFEIGVPQGVKGETGEVSQAQLDAAVATLVAGAPEALDTLDELATALGNDPNFATTVSTAIGERAKTSDVNAALAGKANTSHTHTANQISGAATSALDVSNATLTGGYGVSEYIALIEQGISGALGDKSDVGHTHPVTDLTTTGTASTSTYLRGDGSWQTPTNTTYAVPSQAEAEAGTATTGRAFSAQRVRQAADAAITARVQLVSEFPANPTAGVLYLKAEQ